MMHDARRPALKRGCRQSGVRLFCGFLFLVPLIRALSCRTDIPPTPMRTPCSTRISAAHYMREDYLLAGLECAKTASWSRTPVDHQDSSRWQSRCAAALVTAHHLPTRSARPYRLSGSLPSAAVTKWARRFRKAGSR